MGCPFYTCNHIPFMSPRLGMCTTWGNYTSSIRLHSLHFIIIQLLLILFLYYTHKTSTFSIFICVFGFFLEKIPFARKYMSRKFTVKLHLRHFFIDHSIFQNFQEPSSGDNGNFEFNKSFFVNLVSFHSLINTIIPHLHIGNTCTRGNGGIHIVNDCWG